MILFTSVADAGFDRQFKDRILGVYSLFEELQGRPVKCGYIRRGSALLGTARSWADPQRIALQPGVVLGAVLGVRAVCAEIQRIERVATEIALGAAGLLAHPADGFELVQQVGGVAGQREHPVDRAVELR